MPKVAAVTAAVASQSADSDAPRSALSVRQPWAELILRGTKTIEVRNRPTNVRGRVYLYAGQKLPDGWTEDECEERLGCPLKNIARGKLVGIINITGCRPLRESDSDAAGFEIDDAEGELAWLVEPVSRLEKPIKPKRQPMPSFFFPF